MRNIFRNRRSNSESGASGNSSVNGSTASDRRPGPDEAGPSRPAPIPEERTSPIAMPAGREVQPPGYTSQIAIAPIPSYEAALGASPRAISGFLGDRPRRQSILGTSSGARSSAIADEEDTDEDDPLTPRVIRPSPALNLMPLPQRRATFSTSHRPPTPPQDPQSPHHLPMEIPRPPANALPAYSPHLLRDELRLISAVHLDQTHPAAAFFNHIATSFGAPGGSQREQVGEMSTGTKKMKLVMTRGAERMNANGTGPLFIRLPRGGDIAGRIEVGKADHGTQLEISIIGLVNTSYYIRGQYTLIDTLPLCRRQQILYPVVSDPEDATTEPQDVTVSANGVDADPVATTNGDNPGTIESENAVPSGSGSSESANTAAPANGKEPQQFIAPNTSFEFALKMPSHHYRDSHVDLPPTSSIFQVGMQASVEYVLRVKLTRKGWRLNETITVPLIYEPRAYVSQRRLRALSTDDAMNPGWRTIKLHGGDPCKPTTPGERGVNVSLLLPSPPIVYVPWGAEPPPIPFHLHFHSSLTHALATFSDPTQCQFVIRLMRVASMRIGTEREIRRMEVPAKVEIWQEGGPRILLGEHGKSVSSVSQTPASAPVAGGSSPISPTTSTSASAARRPSAAGTDGTPRRQSFFRRLSLDRSESREQPPLQRQQSAVTPVPAVPPVAEEPEPPSTQHSPELENGTIAESAVPVEAEETTPLSPTTNQTSVLPLSLSSTDVHFLGQLTIHFPVAGPELLRRLVQSYMTPEIGVSYVLEVGLQPNPGSVREAFKHVWGGGMVEVVLGARPPAAEGVDVNLRPADTRS